MSAKISVACVNNTLLSSCRTSQCRTRRCPRVSTIVRADEKIDSSVTDTQNNPGMSKI